MYSICIFSFLRHVETFTYTDGQTARQTPPHKSWELLRRGYFHDWQCSVAAGIGWPSSGPSPSLFWLLSWILLLHKNNYTKPVRAWASLFFSFWTLTCQADIIYSANHTCSNFTSYKNTYMLYSQYLMPGQS